LFPLKIKISRQIYILIINVGDIQFKKLDQKKAPKGALNIIKWNKLS